MKKIVSMILILSLFTINTEKVYAKEVTFSDVANKYKEKYDFNKVDSMLGDLLQEMENNSSVVVSTNEITTTGKDEDKNYTARFKFENNLITYKYSGDRTYSESSVAQTYYDNMAIIKLIYIVAELKGYEVSELSDLDIEEENLTLEKNGIEMNTFKIEYKDEGASASTTSTDTLKIDLNKFNLTGNTNDTPKVEETKPANPQTGSEEYIIPALVLFVSLVTIIKFSKKNYLSKI